MTTALAILLVALLIAPVVWRIYQSNGSLNAVTLFSHGEVLEAFARYCVSDDWTVEYRDRESVFFRKGPSGGTGCLLLILFFPLGLAYLLTDWGRGKLSCRVWTNDDGDTALQIQWAKREVRGAVADFLRWLEEQEEEEDERTDRDDEDEHPIRRRRRKRRRM